LGRTGILADAGTEIVRAVQRLAEGVARWGPEQIDPRANEARRLALRLRDRLVLLYAGSGLAEAVAWRWKAQLNENAKCLAYVSTLPELDHNEVVGWERETPARPHVTVLAIRDAAEHPRVSARFRVTRDVLGSRVTGWEEIRGEPGARLERAMGLVQLGDYVSVYLAGLHEVDPMPVERIDELKRRLGALRGDDPQADPAA
jgi:glucose/mannose-6-phosphate isomerase